MPYGTLGSERVNKGGQFIGVFFLVFFCQLFHDFDDWPLYKRWPLKKWLLNRVKIKCVDCLLGQVAVLERFIISNISNSKDYV